MAFLSIINAIFAQTIIGVNVLSMLTIGFLGIPGVILLYATKLFII